MTNSRAAFISRIHVCWTLKRSQETQYLASILSDTFVKCICRNISCALGKSSSHSRWNVHFHCVTHPWRRTLTNGSDVKYIFPRCPRSPRYRVCHLDLLRLESRAFPAKKTGFLILFQEYPIGSWYVYVSILKWTAVNSRLCVLLENATIYEKILRNIPKISWFLTRRWSYKTANIRAWWL